MYLNSKILRFSPRIIFYWYLSIKSPRCTHRIIFNGQTTLKLPTLIFLQSNSIKTHSFIGIKYRIFFYGQTTLKLPALISNLLRQIP